MTFRFKLQNFSGNMQKKATVTKNNTESLSSQLHFVGHMKVETHEPN